MPRYFALVLFILPLPLFAQLEKAYVDDHVRVFYSVQKPHFSEANAFLAGRGMKEVREISGWSLELFRQQDWNLIGAETGAGQNSFNISTRFNYRMRPWVPEENLQVEARSMSMLFTLQLAHNVSRFLRFGASFGVGPSWVELTEAGPAGKMRYTAPKPEISWLPSVALNIRHGVAAPFLLMEAGYEFQKLDSLSANEQADAAPGSLDFSGPYLALGLGF